MIIVKSPLRLPIAGGGTDLPFYSDNYGGFFITASINKFCYVITNKTDLDKRYFLKYSNTESEHELIKINHPIFREVLRSLKVKPGIEITTFLDVPYSTGLGSSSSFTVGLLKCLLAYKNKKIDPYKLSKYSINIERSILNNYGGIQDQIASAYGGFREVVAKKKYNFISRKMNISRDTISILSENLFLFYTGVTRSSSKVQKNVKKKILTNPKLLNYYHEIKELAYKSKNALVRGDVDEYGKLMNKHWIAKNKTLKNTDKLNNFDEIYSKCISLGALGGKIIGAGAGGFFLVYLNKKNNSPLKLKRLMAKYNYIELPFQFSEEGASVTYL